MNARPDPGEPRRRGAPPDVFGLAAAAGVAGLSTGAAWVLFGRDQLADVVMTYLLGIVVVSSRLGLGPSLLLAFLSVAAFDFFFISPVFTFAVADLRHAVTFAVMFLVAVVISGLTERVKKQTEAARLRTEETERVRREVEAEQLRNTLLSSVSHDLRTPLAVIQGAATTLVESSPEVSEETRLELTRSIVEEAERLSRLIQNLLDMTRLEAGSVKLRKDWCPLEEVIGSTLNHLDARLAGRNVVVHLPDDLPLVPCDPVLLEQVFVNLLENAAKYGADPIEVRAVTDAGCVNVEIVDRGPGIPLGQEGRVFEKFFRGQREGGAVGAGLGLAICRAIVAAHGGAIHAENRPGGGAVLAFSLPLEGGAPTLERSEAETVGGPGAP